MSWLVSLRVACGVTFGFFDGGGDVDDAEDAEDVVDAEDAEEDGANSDVVGADASDIEEVIDRRATPEVVVV